MKNVNIKASILTAMLLVLVIFFFHMMALTITPKTFIIAGVLIALAMSTFFIRGDTSRISHITYVPSFGVGIMLFYELMCQVKEGFSCFAEDKDYILIMFVTLVFCAIPPLVLHKMKK